MQDYPVYEVRGDASGEKAVIVEVRVSLEAGGGLEGMPSAESVVQALLAAMTAAGAESVRASVQSVQTADIAKG